jgi:CheY-like chemotaxis protein
VVENEEDDVILLKAMLQKSRIRNPIQVVSTVEEAICYLKGEGVFKDRDEYPFPVLALLDVHLPGGLGYDVIDWVRRDLREVTMGLVILTGSDIKGVREAYRRGADSFLVKPLNFEDFRNMATGLRGINMVEGKDGFALQLSDDRASRRTH